MEYGRATWVLAGGTAPMLAYKILLERYSSKINWRKIWFVMGDERCVKQNSQDSNWKQICSVLLDHLPVPENQKLAPKYELSSEEASYLYAKSISVLPMNQISAPRFDHVWLGVGEDGHTLSLFPGLFLPEDPNIVTAVHDSPKPPSERISLSMRALSNVGCCLVIASGAAKANAVARAIDGDLSLPITQVINNVENTGGQVGWLLDKAAGSQLYI
jgi:6-phosphogluconolactonase